MVKFFLGSVSISSLNFGFGLYTIRKKDCSKLFWTMLIQKLDHFFKLLNKFFKIVKFLIIFPINWILLLTFFENHLIWSDFFSYPKSACKISRKFFWQFLKKIVEKIGQFFYKFLYDLKNDLIYNNFSLERPASSKFIENFSIFDSVFTRLLLHEICFLYLREMQQKYLFKNNNSSLWEF